MFHSKKMDLSILNYDRKYNKDNIMKLQYVLLLLVIATSVCNGMEAPITPEDQITFRAIPTIMRMCQEIIISYPIKCMVMQIPQKLMRMEQLPKD